MVKLLSLCDVSTGKRDANHAVAGGMYRFYTCAANYLMCNTYTFDGQCLILPGNGVNVGEVYRYSGKFEAYQRTYVAYNIKSDLIDYDFLYYVFLLKWKSVGTAKQFGAATNFIKIGNFKDFEIPLPLLPEQERIVSILDAEFAKIDALKAGAEKSLQHAKDLFQAALREELQPKEGWVTKELRDIADFFNGKAHEQCIDEDGKYILVNSKFISSDTKKAKRTNSQLFPLYEGDIVMVMSDVPNGKALAKCIIIPEDNVYSLNQRICAFRSSRINVRFLYYLINRNPYLLSFDNGENQTNLRKNDILKMKLSYPVNTDEISEILERLDRILPRINSLILNIEKTIVECEALKQALLRKAFSGEL